MLTGVTSGHRCKRKQHGPGAGPGQQWMTLTNCLHRPMHRCILREHSWHWRMTLIFLVVLAFLWKMGLVWPPKPCCFLSYRRLPCATSESFPFLYWDTLWSMCLLHLRQCVRTAFGNLTMASDAAGPVVQSHNDVLHVQRSPSPCAKIPSPTCRAVPDESVPQTATADTHPHAVAATGGAARDPTGLLAVEPSRPGLRGHSPGVGRVGARKARTPPHAIRRAAMLPRLLLLTRSADLSLIPSASPLRRSKPRPTAPDRQPRAAGAVPVTGPPAAPTIPPTLAPATPPRRPLTPPGGPLLRTRGG